MALKADRHEESTDISFFYNEGTATRGGVVILDAAAIAGASGAAMDQGESLVKYAAAAVTDIPVGILLNDVVNKDLTRTHVNFHKDEVQKGGKVTLLTKGWVVTNSLYGTPAAGNLAYLGQSGNIATATYGADFDGMTEASNVVGRFTSSVDQNGYAKVFIDLPNNNK